MLRLMKFKTSRLSVKTQTNVRYHPQALTTTMRKTTQFVFRAGRKLVSEPREALFLCRMAWWVSVLSVAARCFSLPRALAIVAGGELNTTPSDDAETQKRLARSIDLVLSANVLHLKPICWKRAAVLHRYLLREGIQTRIVFGVRNEVDGKVDGHAWLEAAGEPILEKTPPEYVVTYRFPSHDTQNKKGEAIERLSS